MSTADTRAAALDVVHPSALIQPGADAVRADAVRAGAVGPDAVRSDRAAAQPVPRAAGCAGTHRSEHVP
jgi:hypothetical protein